MSNTRREFLQSSAALALGMMGSAATTLAAEPAAAAPASQSATAPGPSSYVQVPKMKFGNVEIGRLVLGVNPLYGFAHSTTTSATR